MYNLISDLYRDKPNVFVKEIEHKDIVTEASLRSLCEMNSCGNYGKNWMCPPHIKEIDETIGELKVFNSGVLMQTVYQLTDAYDFDGMMEALKVFNDEFNKLIDEVAQHVKREDLLALGCGGCNVCKTCAKIDDEECRYPEKARSSVEAYGVDVNRTVTNVGLKYNNGQNTVSYVGMVLKK